MHKKIKCEPYLKWVGSKKKIIKHLLNRMPDEYNNYIEPFLGSGCLYFAVSPKQAIINDINSDLIDVYRILKEHPTSISEYLQAFPKTKEYYLELRGVSTREINDIYKASRFIYLNRFCFNGIYRTNMKGDFNVPYGSKTGGVVSEDKLVECSKVLRNSEIYSLDFFDLLNKINKDDFIYLDPPYVTHSNKIFVEYGLNSFIYKDLKRLSEFMNSIDDIGAKCMLSYISCPEIYEILNGKWNTLNVKVRRNISGKLIARNMADELIATNY